MVVEEYSDVDRIRGVLIQNVQGCSDQLFVLEQAPIYDLVYGLRRNPTDVIVDSQIHTDSAKSADASNDSTSIWAFANLIQKKPVQGIRPGRIRHDPIRNQALGDIPHVVSQLRQTKIVRETENDCEHIAG